MLISKSKRTGFVVLFTCLVLYINWLYLDYRQSSITQDVTEITSWSINDSLKVKTHQVSPKTKSDFRPKMVPHKLKITKQPELALNPNPPETANSAKTPFHPSKKVYSRERVIQPIDINLADQKAWESLPGIGPYYAKIILNFRQKLGGFTSISQIKETWYLPDSVFTKALPYLTHQGGILKYIFLNSCTAQELAAHPYLNERQAKAIINYRFQHGQFKNIEDLRQVRLLEKELIEKISPYLKVESEVAAQL